MNYIIYNPLADNFNGDAKLEENIKVLEDLFKDFKPLPINQVNWDEFFQSLTDEDNIVLCGGDGTINRFANVYYGKNVKGNFFLRYSGTGNDFARDIDESLTKPVIPLNEYLKKLPKVIISYKEYKERVRKALAEYDREYIVDSDEHYIKSEYEDRIKQLKQNKITQKQFDVSLFDDFIGRLMFWC